MHQACSKCLWKGRGGEGQSMAPIRGHGYVGPELLFGLNWFISIFLTFDEWEILYLLQKRVRQCRF